MAPIPHRFLHLKVFKCVNDNNFFPAKLLNQDNGN